MDLKSRLQISINEANSLKQITKMSGWDIIENHIKESEKKCIEVLKNIDNKDLIDIQSARFLLGWIKNFNDLFRYKEISASIEEQELKKIKGE